MIPAVGTVVCFIKQPHNLVPVGSCYRVEGVVGRGIDLVLVDGQCWAAPGHGKCCGPLEQVRILESDFDTYCEKIP